MCDSIDLNADMLLSSDEEETYKLWQPPLPPAKIRKSSLTEGLNGHSTITTTSLPAFEVSEGEEDQLLLSPSPDISRKRGNPQQSMKKSSSSNRHPGSSSSSNNLRPQHPPGSQNNSSNRLHRHDSGDHHRKRKGQRSSALVNDGGGHRIRRPYPYNNGAIENLAGQERNVMGDATRKQLTSLTTDGGSQQQEAISLLSPLTSRTTAAAEIRGNKVFRQQPKEESSSDDDDNNSVKSNGSSSSVASDSSSSSTTSSHNTSTCGMRTFVSQNANKKRKIDDDDMDLSAYLASTDTESPRPGGVAEEAISSGRRSPIMTSNNYDNIGVAHEEEEQQQQMSISDEEEGSHTTTPIKAEITLDSDDEYSSFGEGRGEAFTAPPLSTPIIIRWLLNENLIIQNRKIANGEISEARPNGAALIPLGGGKNNNVAIYMEAYEANAARLMLAQRRPLSDEQMYFKTLQTKEQKRNRPYEMMPQQSQRGPFLQLHKSQTWLPKRQEEIHLVPDMKYLAQQRDACFHNLNLHSDIRASAEAASPVTELMNACKASSNVYVFYDVEGTSEDEIMENIISVIFMLASILYNVKDVVDIGKYKVHLSPNKSMEMVSTVLRLTKEYYTFLVEDPHLEWSSLYGQYTAGREEARQRKMRSLDQLGGSNLSQILKQLGIRGSIEKNFRALLKREYTAWEARAAAGECTDLPELLEAMKHLSMAQLLMPPTFVPPKNNNKSHSSDDDDDDILEAIDFSFQGGGEEDEEHHDVLTLQMWFSRQSTPHVTKIPMQAFGKISSRGELTSELIRITLNQIVGPALKELHNSMKKINSSDASKRDKKRSRKTYGVMRITAHEEPRALQIAHAARGEEMARPLTKATSRLETYVRVIGQLLDLVGHKFIVGDCLSDDDDDNHPATGITLTWK